MINYKRSINQYLAELALLLKLKPDLSKVLPLEETKKLAIETKNHLYRSRSKKIFKFKEREGNDFNKFIATLFEVTPQTWMIWTHFSNDCGSYMISSLKEFNFLFPFDVNKNGIIAFLSADLSHKITLDFYHENNDEILEIDLMDRVK